MHDTCPHRKPTVDQDEIDRLSGRLARLLAEKQMRESLARRIVAGIVG